MTQKKYYPEVSNNPDFPKIEEEVISRWKKQGVFEQSVNENPAEKDNNNNEFVFYDGPPFANGLPHYGHLLTGFVKDIFARYQTMKGKRVERRFGWDCHGLPAEMGAEKELGISGRFEIEKYGIDKFNNACRTSVMKYTSEWEQYVTRQARWVDFKNDYKTMDKGYMESVLWAFKQLWDKGLVYESMRVMPYSWACETPLSNFETRMDNSYRERVDKAITVAFELDEVPEFVKSDFPGAKVCKVLAWTTTPWTLPSNLALAVGKDIRYHAVYVEGVVYVRSILSYNGGALPRGDIDIGGSTFSGNKLVGLTYKPLFPYFAKYEPGINIHTMNKEEPRFRILDGTSFVTDSDGTGIVHLAPGFGEDDQRVAAENGIYVVCPVDNAGRFTAEIFDIEGLSLKGKHVIWDEASNHKETGNEYVIRYLKDKKLIIGNPEQYKHNYPHCWRTDTPLIYKAVPSWYVEVTKFKDQMVELNQKINWIPNHVRDGQFGKWLENARDWSISRNRYWGAPIPVWKSDNPNSNEPMKAFGSIKELEGFFNQPVEDLHRPFIDNLTRADDPEQPENPRYFYKRVSDVFDCWFESGSMPFAQVHYPFENKEWFESHFSADFIVEYVAQTRGWFYTLMVLHTALHYDAPYNEAKLPPFKNVICHGVVLDDKGQKLSKRLNNYADPMDVFNKFGADAMRWVMISAPIMHGGELLIDKDGNMVRDAVRLVLKPVWNAYNFFTMYANADLRAGNLDEVNYIFSEKQYVCNDYYNLDYGDAHNLMDRYIQYKTIDTVNKIKDAMDAYDTPAACKQIESFFEVLNNWYIRRNKDRFWKSEKDTDKQAAYDTLYSVLHIMCRAMAPLLPLISEEIWQGLTSSLRGGVADAAIQKNVILNDSEGSTKVDPSVAKLPQDDKQKLAMTNSVHLQEFPKLNDYDKEVHIKKLSGNQDVVETNALVPSILIREMDHVRDICNAALAIRSEANIRVRQPLQSLSIVREKKYLFTTYDEFMSLIIDEVNVKEVRAENRVEDYASYKLKINFPILGKRLPEKMKQIIPASKKGEWRRLDNGNIEIIGEELLPEECSLLLEPKNKQGAQALSTNDALVILDLEITDELRIEGIYRDLVRFVQQSRKEADLNIVDRIDLSIETANIDIKEAVGRFNNAIAEQTLSVSVSVGDTKSYNHHFEQQLEGENVVIGFKKVA